MKTCIIAVALLPILYALSWTVSYIAFMGNDLKYYFDYLRLVWSGKGGELPTFIQLFALVITVVGFIAFLVTCLVKRKGNDRVIVKRQPTTNHVPPV